ncbi:MAG: hypothetical protein RL716_880 [Actinomycetota bacterium]
MRAYLLIMLAAAAVTFVGTYLVLKLAHKYKIYPQIRSRDVHTKPTPRLGGVAMFFGFAAAVLVAGSLGWFESVFAEPVHILAILAAAFLITVIGFLDDLYANCFATGCRPHHWQFWNLFCSDSFLDGLGHERGEFY